MLNICIGYDRRESIAYHVLAHSIMRRASGPVTFTPLYLPALERRIYKRERDPGQSTDFTFSRFLTPWLTESSNSRSIFMDCDMLCLGDIYELEQLARDQLDRDVLVVKHDYTPTSGMKFLHQPNAPYPCKNWSSVMVFNGHRMAVRKLTPSYVNKATAMELHQFKWASEKGVGNLPPAWNHLVGEYEPNPQAKLVHYTLGGPWFPEYADCEFSEEWRAELAHMSSAG